MENIRKHLVWINTPPFDSLDVTTWLFTAKELRKSDWDVTLIAPGQAGKQEKLGVEYDGVPISNIYLLGQLIYHARVLRYISHLAQEPDVIMFHEISTPVFMLSRFFRNLTGKKRPLYVLDIRSVPMETKETATWKDRLRNKYFYLGNWLANRGAVDGRVVITRRIAQVLQIPEDRLWGIWSSGVQPEMFSKAQKIRDWQGIHDQVNLIYIGSLSIGRNLDVFARAVIAANQQGMKFTMTFVGEGNNVSGLRILEDESGGSIRVIPSVPHDQVQEWLAQAHIGVLPFPDEEKFRVSSPIKLFEYAASGLAILATRIECHTSVISTENMVLWAEESSVESFVACLKNAWQLRDALSGMGEQAEKASHKWTWAESAANLGRALDQGISRYG